MTGYFVFFESSLLFALGNLHTFRANSITAHCKPRQIPKNGILFSAATGDQVSHWYPEKKHGLFTYFFLKGLKGDADDNYDREISIKELAKYIKENVTYMARRLGGRDQTPQVIGQDESRALGSETPVHGKSGWRALLQAGGSLSSAHPLQIPQIHGERSAG